MIADNKSLCLALIKAETEEDVVKILHSQGYWNDDSVWHDFGDNENNFSTIGNQQSRADTALVEKIINSVDAVLLKEALRRNIDPESNSAPQGTPQALQTFFGIREGKLTNVSSSARSDLAKNIMLIATGSKSNPNYAIADLGEGQTPEMMPKTFLSLNSSNKLRIPFVQGKFNMGGTGSLQFCGVNNLQLIITRKDPALVQDPNLSNDWGFTIIRREDPKKGVRSSVFKYLYPSEKILSFSAHSINLLPGEYPEPYEKPMEYGSYIKLFDYRFGQKALKTNIQFDLYNRLSSLLPSIALPVTMYERRAGYKGHSFETILSGLRVRIDEDKLGNIEDGFPASSEISVFGEKMSVSIYAFKKGKREKYTKNDGILFTYNGQTHGFINKSFFEKKPVDMSYLSDSILVFIDCSQISGRAREDLFMNSRDRLREGSLLVAIEKEVAKILSSHPGLRTLSESRRRDELNKNLADSKPLAETLERIIKQSPALSSLFNIGARISNPFNLSGATEAEEFKSKKYPTYFELSNSYKSRAGRPTNHAFRISFDTDAENEYFVRDENPGSITVTANGEEAQNYSCNLWNGKATLNLAFPKDVIPGNNFEYKIVVDGSGQNRPFENEFTIEATMPIIYNPTPGDSDKRKKPPSDKRGKEKKRPSSLALPSITEIHKSDWNNHGFNEYSALEIKSYEDQYDFFINVDNSFLLNEIKINPRTAPDVIRMRFINALVLVGLALLNKYEQSSDPNDAAASPYERIADVAEAIAPIICPMIDKLGTI